MPCSSRPDMWTTSIFTTTKQEELVPHQKLYASSGLGSAFAQSPMPKNHRKVFVPRFLPYDEHGRCLAFCGRCFTVVVDNDHIDCQEALPPYEP